MKSLYKHKWLIAIAALVVLSGGGAIYVKARGIRNKNPGNIRWNEHNDWNGQVGQDDAGYAIFSDAKFGIRAMGKVLDSYNRRGVVTIRQIIEVWAPNTENNTEAYIADVVERTGFQEHYVPVRQEGDYPALVKAIIKHENGVIHYDDEFIKESLDLA